MKITQDEVHSIEDIGTMNERPVRMIKMKGGFHIAVGKKRGSHSDEALSAGSHPAIVKYNLEKQFPDYKPDLRKSESGIEPIVERHSHFLNDDLRKGGYDVFSVQTGPDIEFQVTKHNAKIASVKASLDEDNLFLYDLNIPKDFTHALAGAATEKALSCKAGLTMRR
jgi:hypothetical protein